MTTRNLFLLFLTAGLLTSAAAGALTYVTVADSALVDRAEAIVLGTFESRSVGDETGRVMTSYEFDVEKVLHGDHLGSRLIVRVLGGVDLDRGLVVKIFGTPEFSPGDPALLFLAQARDGSFRVLHIFQGAFTARQVDGRRIYERPGADRFEVSKSKAGFSDRAGSARLTFDQATPTTRDADRFEQWILDRLDGVERETDYLIPEPAARSTAFTSEFTYLAGDEFILRWFEFDDKRKVRWHRHVDGQVGFPGGGSKEFKKARKAWKKKFSGVPIKLASAGTTTSTTGFSAPDGRNTLLHRDFNNYIGGAFDCSEGGTLAVGGLLDAFPSATAWKGFSPLVSVEGEIIMNDGIECFVGSDSDILGQIYAHELGHTLGLGHSCGDGSSPKCKKSAFLADALMAASLDQIFGAEIHDDDVLAARQLYDEDFWAASCENRVPGAKSFCAKCGPCGEGQGNCKRDSDCFGTLVCTQDVGADFGFKAGVNVCTEP